jgi:hypothetical protein
VIYIFCLLTVGRLFSTDSCQQFYVTVRINTCTVLSKVTAVVANFIIKSQPTLIPNLFAGAVVFLYGFKLTV